MRFVASADWQLGMTAHFLSPEARPRFADARLSAVRRIGEIAAETDAAFVVVGGDVFEHNQLDRRIVLRTFEVLREFTVPVYLLPGNHDPLDASSIYHSADFRRHCPPHVHVLDNTGIVEVLPGVEIVAAPWPHKNPKIDLVAHACAELEPAEGVARILVGHGAVASLDPDRASLRSIQDSALRAALDDGRIRFAVLGDRHSTTEVMDRVWYPGTPEVTSRTEVDPGNALVIDMAGADTTVRPVHTGSWRFRVEERQLDSDADLDAFEQWFDRQPDKHETALWLKLEGTLSVTQKARLDAFLLDKQALYAMLDIWERHENLHVIADDADFADLGLTGFADDAVEELRSLADAEGENAEASRNALALLVRLVGGAA